MKKLRGDTLIEVMFAVAVFGMLTVGTISIMNRGVQTAETSLEITMARSEIDNQAEALRYIHNAYMANEGNENDGSYSEAWNKITSLTYDPGAEAGNDAKAEWMSIKDDFNKYDSEDRTCEDLYENLPNKSFIINTKDLGGNDLANAIVERSATNSDKIAQAQTYPRLLYGNPLFPDEEEILSDKNAINKTAFNGAEGIWITGIKSASGLQCTEEEGGYKPDFYDFYIRTCWEAPNGNSSTTISSIIRLFNPDQIDNTKITEEITFENGWDHYDNISTHRAETSIGSSCNGFTDTTAEGGGIVYDERRWIACTNSKFGTAEIYDDTHVRTNDSNDVIFSGYTNSAMDEGIRTSLEGLTNFTLDVDIDVNYIIAHPGGTLTISVGPARAELDASGGKLVTKTDNNSIEITDRKFHLSLVKDEDNYSVCVEGINNDGNLTGDKKCLNVVDSNTNYKYADFNFKHSSHSCGTISKVFLYDIHMTSVEERIYGNSQASCHPRS